MGYEIDEIEKEIRIKYNRLVRKDKVFRKFHRNRGIQFLTVYGLNVKDINALTRVQELFDNY